MADMKTYYISLAGMKERVRSRGDFLSLHVRTIRVLKLSFFSLSFSSSISRPSFLDSCHLLVFYAFLNPGALSCSFDRLESGSTAQLYFFMRTWGSSAVPEFFCVRQSPATRETVPWDRSRLFKIKHTYVLHIWGKYMDYIAVYTFIIICMTFYDLKVPYYSKFSSMFIAPFFLFPSTHNGRSNQELALAGS